MNCANSVMSAKLNEILFTSNNNFIYQLSPTFDNKHCGQSTLNFEQSTYSILSNVPANFITIMSLLLFQGQSKEIKNNYF